MVAEEENELPEATSDALIGRKRRVDEMVMGEMDKAVKSVQETERVGRGGMKGRCTKAREGKEKMPSKRAYLSDMDNDQELRACKKVGRNYGAVNWRELDLTALLDLVEEILLAGKKEWVRLYSWFSKWDEDNDHPIQSADTIEKQFKTISSLHLFLDFR